jgi:hypothetical protein
MKKLYGIRSLDVLYPFPSPLSRFHVFTLLRKSDVSRRAIQTLRPSTHEIGFYFDVFKCPVLLTSLSGHMESPIAPGHSWDSIWNKDEAAPPSTGMVLLFSSGIVQHGPLFCWYQIQQKDAYQLRLKNTILPTHSSKNVCLFTLNFKPRFSVRAFFLFVLYFCSFFPSSSLFSHPIVILFTPLLQTNERTNERTVTLPFSRRVHLLLTITNFLTFASFLFLLTLD